MRDIPSGGGAGRGTGRGATRAARDAHGYRSAGTGARDWGYLGAAALAGTALVFAGTPWAVPVGQAGLAYFILWRDLRAGDLWGAARRMLLWALLVSICAIAVTLAYPQGAQEGILRGAAYRDEMFSWIRTGIGAESTPSQFVPQHALHYSVTLALSFATAGVLGLVLGAFLLNYMNFYVGSLILYGAEPWLAAAVGWPVWPIVRVIGFVLGAIAMAHLLLGRVLGRSPWRPGAFRRMLAWSLALFLADMVIKAVLAPHWRKLLERALEG